jgi:hypothetical protein
VEVRKGRGKLSQKYLVTSITIKENALWKGVRGINALNPRSLTSWRSLLIIAG